MRILITGLPGEGKTMTALAIYKLLTRLGFEVKVNDDSDFLEKLTSSFPYEDALRNLAPLKKSTVITVVCSDPDPVGSEIAIKKRLKKVT